MDGVKEDNIYYNNYTISKENVKINCVQSNALVAHSLILYLIFTFLKAVHTKTVKIIPSHEHRGYHTKFSCGESPIT